MLSSDYLLGQLGENVDTVPPLGRRPSRADRRPDQRQRLTLIAGETLANQGTLRATDTLSAAHTMVLNAGLMEAGDRLSVLAADSVVNTRGGILAGRDVDVTALSGDILNERTVTRFCMAFQRKM